MRQLRAARPDAGQKGGDGRVPVRQHAERLAVAAVDRLRAADALPRQMLHQPEEPGQIGRIDPLLVQV